MAVHPKAELLKHIIDHRKTGSLGFYRVFLGGMRKIIFPEIAGAFTTFSETKDWGIIDQARREGYRRAEQDASQLIELFQQKKDSTALVESIESEILKDVLP